MYSNQGTAATYFTMFKNKLRRVRGILIAEKAAILGVFSLTAFTSPFYPQDVPSWEYEGQL